MGRVIGQPPTAPRNEKAILSAREPTSAGKCGPSLVAFSCPTFVCPCNSAKQGIFYCPERGDLVWVYQSVTA